jgi:hypothetical protein
MNDLISAPTSPGGEFLFHLTDDAHPGDAHLALDIIESL